MSHGAPSGRFAPLVVFVLLGFFLEGSWAADCSNCYLIGDPYDKSDCLNLCYSCVCGFYANLNGNIIHYGCTGCSTVYITPWRWVLIVLSILGMIGAIAGCIFCCIRRNRAGQDATAAAYAASAGADPAQGYPTDPAAGYPVGAYPPGAYPPPPLGAYPPGAYPPPPPGQYPPQALYPPAAVVEPPKP